MDDNKSKINVDSIVDPRTGEVHEIIDMDDEQVARLYMSVNDELLALEDMKNKIKVHLNERLEENTKDFGVQDFDVQFRVVKEYDIPEEVEIEVDGKKVGAKETVEKYKKDAKKIFDKYKIDVGIARVETRVMYKSEMKL